MAKPEVLREGNPCQSQRTGEEHSDNTVLPVPAVALKKPKPGEFC